MSYSFGNWMMACFGLGFLTTAIDLILQATWNQVYLTKGLKIVEFRFPGCAICKGVPFLSELKDEFPFSVGLPFVSLPLPAIAFHKIDNYTLAFRERLFSRKIPIGIMHGLLEFRPQEKQVVVVGIVSWFAFLFVAGIIFGVLNLGLELSTNSNTSDSFIFLLLIAAMVYLYRIGRVRLFQVGKVASDLWLKNNE